MPIFGDSLGREWIECAGVNPDLVDQFRPALVSFVALDRQLHGGLVGSGFFIGASPHFGLVLTAKHVLVEGVLGMQQPKLRHAASALSEFLPTASRRPSLEKGKLTAIWADNAGGHALSVQFASYNESSDLACCLVFPPENLPSPLLFPSVPISTQIPKVGDIAHMVSWDKMASQAGEGDAQSRLHSAIRFLSIRRGTVTGVYADQAGYYRYRWPCFTTSIPAEPGMSGGFVYLPRDGGNIIACGVVSADNSTDAARTDQMQAGESVIALSYMALDLDVPIETRNDSPRRSIQQMMRDGDLDMAVGGIEQFKFRRT